MKYILENKFHGDYNVIEINKLKARSYFIPYSNKEEAIKVDLLDKRYKSDLVTCLNGDWDFKFYNNPNDLPNEFDTDKESFDKIDVPSVWQYRGYSYPAYINICYPFTYNPPYVPINEPVTKFFDLVKGKLKPNKDEYNFVGVYRTFIDIDDLDYRYIISFLGVASCLELYINGKFVGYSEGSHNTAEFDLNKYLIKGKNELLCVVHRWCNGTYLECQDMFRNNGIFRDVLLRKEEKEDIYDIDFITSKVENFYNAKVVIEATGNIDVTISLCGNTKTIKCEKGLNEVIFEKLNIIEWNAEKPTTYDLIIETNHSVIVEKVGFKTVKINGDLFLLNDKKVKLRGVNHHDTSPINGYTMSPQDILVDIKNCKDYNVNTIRTSHYPADPLLVELATVYGIYLVDEADIETHGVTFATMPYGNMSKVSNNPVFKQHYLDRAVRHYQRDKLLKTPVIMWSIGNESGDGCNTHNNYDYYKLVSDIPVQYESAVHEKQMAYDVASEMYPSVEKIVSVGNKTIKVKEFIDRPYFLCEYAHAMGVGPGNIEGYMEAFYKYDSLIGGCIWEMNDHGVLEKDGHYTYGGDHGEWLHDSNFCCDGLFYPNRKPSTGAFIMKHAYRPIRVTRIKNNEFEIFNTTSFTSGKNYKLEVSINNGLHYELNEDVAPLERKTIKLDLGENKDLLLMNIKTFDITNNKYVDEDQIILNEVVRSDVEIVDVLPNEVSFVDGNPVINYKGTKLEVSDLSTIIFRANTDNDKKNFLFKTMPKWYDEKESKKKVTKHNNVIEVKYLVKANKKIFKVTDTYQGCKEGLLVTSTIKGVLTSGFLPRFGKAYKLDESFDTVAYLGKENETYLDMQEQSVIGTFTKKVSEMTEPNIKPQESGNRMHCQYVSTTNGKVTYTFKVLDKPFELGVKPYSDKELTKMAHTTDEKVTGTYITLSAFQCGIGTGSCGPEVLEKHQYPANKEYKIRYIISWK